MCQRCGSTALQLNLFATGRHLSKGCRVFQARREINAFGRVGLSCSPRADASRWPAFWLLGGVLSEAKHVRPAGLLFCTYVGRFLASPTITRASVVVFQDCDGNGQNSGEETVSASAAGVGLLLSALSLSWAPGFGARGGFAAVDIKYSCTKRPERGQNSRCLVNCDRAAV